MLHGGARQGQAHQCLVPAWQCRCCHHECLPVRSESRCICGHRLKLHAQNDPENDDPFRCKDLQCNCPSFFYIAAEGSWILRCQCKHKHTDHDPTSHACTQKKCSCTRFCSPWVCNCGHAWAEHDMILKRKAYSMRFASLAQAANVDPALVLADTSTASGSDWVALHRGC